MASESIAELETTFDRLWPLLRSITGAGLRESLDILGGIIPLDRMEIPSGTKVFDWTIPKEWVVREAYVITPDGERILDVAENNLHLVGYSTPFRGVLTRAELDQHLHSAPERPDAIPYITSYYQPRWGFCVSQRARDALREGLYEVVVDTDLIDGALSIGEAVLPGQTDEEVLFSSYLCHPSMANNELSGPIVLAYLYRRIAAMPERRYTYRFVLAPETIGSIAYLHRRGVHRLHKYLRVGYVLTCLGASAPFTYKRSRQHESLADRAAVYAPFGQTTHFHRDVPFHPDNGSDERQYCSPGFDLPVGSIMRTPYGQYPEYHTSDDNKDLISFPALREAIDVCEEIVRTLELNQTYKRTDPFCEPMLSKRDLYPTLGGPVPNADVSALMWALNYSDGKHDLLWIAERSGHDLARLAQMADAAAKADLLALA